LNPTPLIRTLDQEVLALLRGASLECLVCGEFLPGRDDRVLERRAGCVEQTRRR